MKKIVKSLVATTLVATLGMTNVYATSKNYLSTGKNYYTDASINKGAIDVTVAEMLRNDAGTLNALKATYGNDVANLKVYEFYTKYGYSPEDRYATWPVRVTDLNGRLANTSTRQSDPVTSFEFPSTIFNRGNQGIKQPNMFSRLTVGAEPALWTTIDRTWNYSSTKGFEVMKNFIGYGWDATVDDFILNKDSGYNNNIAIATRYNAERNDVWLTMRGGSPDRYNSYLTGTRAFLSATSRSNVALKEKTINDTNTKKSEHFYINTTTKIGISEAGFDYLSEDGWGGLIPGGKTIIARMNPFKEANKALSNRLITAFNEDVNKNLDTIEAVHPNRAIFLSAGGNIQLTGLYRTSSLDGDMAHYTANEATRVDDAKHIVDVEYYMYNTFNNNALMSPNKAKFEIETTRPYFSNFNDLSATITVNDTLLNDAAVFNTTLGLDSFEVKDEGILKDGSKVSVDESRVRVRLQVDNQLQSQAYTLDELKAELLKDTYAGKEVTLVYTYAATDAEDAIIGLVPTEIDTNTGAYAVPIVRKVVVPVGQLSITKVDSKDATVKLAGVKFEVKKLVNDVVDNSFTPLTLVTDVNGNATVTLKHGDYQVQEISTVDGYVLKDTIYNVKVSDDAAASSIVISNDKKIVPVDPKPDNNKTKDPVNTSDTTNMISITLLAISVLGLIKLKATK